MTKKIFISCGEFSGEQHAANLTKSLLKQNPNLEIYAFGSSLLAANGAKVIVDYKDYSFSGITEVIKNLSKIFEAQKLITEKLLEIKPDIVVLVDYGGFNLKLAKNIHQEFKRLNIPRPKIFEFIAPQIWASRPWRINKIKSSVDMVLCTLPFEEKLYQNAGIPVKYVGNPVAASIEANIDKSTIYRELGIRANPQEEILIGVFPGSRKSEIQYMYPMMQKAANKLMVLNPNKRFRFLLAKAPNLPYSVFENYDLKFNNIELIDPKQISNLNHKLLSASDCLWLCSGTVTLEAALLGTPYFLAYRSNILNYILYLIFRITKMAGLANIISGKYLVKEFLQYDATIDNFVNETQSWLSSEGFSDYYHQIKNDLVEFKKSLLVEDTFDLVAEEINKSS